MHLLQIHTYVSEQIELMEANILSDDLLYQTGFLVFIFTLKNKTKGDSTVISMICLG